MDMDTTINEIGKNAGIVWRTLEKEKLSWERLLEATTLHPLALSAAIGWLAREDKIVMEAEKGIMYFSLHPTWYF